MTCLPGIVCKEGLRVVSDDDWMTMEELQLLFPRVAEPKAEGTRATLELEGSVSVEHPWLQQFMATGARRPSKVPAEPPDHEQEDDADDGASASSGASVASEEVWDELEMRRQHWQVVDPVEYDAFSWELLGGKWTALNKGCSFDAFKAEGKPMVREWLLSHRLALSFSASIALYGEEEAQLLVSSWCHRLNFFWSHWLSAGDPTCWGTVAANYEEPPDLAGAYANGSSAFKRRVDGLRGIVPR